MICEETLAVALSGVWYSANGIRTYLEDPLKIIFDPPTFDKNVFRRYEITFG